MISSAIPRQQLHGTFTVQAGIRDRGIDINKGKGTSKMDIAHRYYLPHRHNFSLCRIQFTILSSVVLWSSVYHLGVQSCSLGVLDGKMGCYTSNDGFSECIFVKPCVRMTITYCAIYTITIATLSIYIPSCKSHPFHIQYKYKLKSPQRCLLFSYFPFGRGLPHNMWYLFRFL